MFNDMYIAINAINNMSKDNLTKFMKENGIDEKRFVYVCNHIRSFLSNSKESSKRLFINSLDENIVDDIFLKYFNSSKMSRCHSLNYDVIAMMKNSLYIDALEDMYEYLSNKIETFREEVLLGFITGCINESFNNEIKDIIGKDIGIKYVSSN